MSALPYAQLVAAVRTAGNRAGTLRHDALVSAITPWRNGAYTPTATNLARLVNADAATVRELEVEIGALEPSAQALVSALSAALVSLPDEAAVVSRALLGISGACAGVFYAHVPWSSVIDATLLEACRATGALFPSPPQGRDAAQRAECLVLRVARALAVPVRGLEEPQAIAKRLAELDPAVAELAARHAALTHKLRASLPKV